MLVINHQDKFKEGTRVLLLAGRKKDGIENRRKIFRVSHYPESFDSKLSELLSISREGERIYVSASPRNIENAMKEFEYRMMKARHDNNTYEFFYNINRRWISCLMDTRSQYSDDTKLWLIDCDDENTGDYHYCLQELNSIGAIMELTYPTKNGVHILVRPFNRNGITYRLEKNIQTNPMMLWAY